MWGVRYVCNGYTLSHPPSHPYLESELFLVKYLKNTKIQFLSIRTQVTKIMSYSCQTSTTITTPYDRSIQTADLSSPLLLQIPVWCRCNSDAMDRIHFSTSSSASPQRWPEREAYSSTLVRGTLHCIKLIERKMWLGYLFKNFIPSVKNKNLYWCVRENWCARLPETISHIWP